MKNIHKFFLFFSAIVFSSLPAFAEQEEIEMADQLRSSGKIYIVVAVLLIILIGLIIFMIQIDRKVSRLEKKNQNNS